MSPAAVDELYRRVRERLALWVAAGDWQRTDDGYVFAAEIGQLLAYAALAGDEPLYRTMREYAIKHLILDDPTDPFTQGMVLWRFNPAAKPDATGTTEPLRIAQGLWLGSTAFGDPTDRALAIKLVKGYVRHQYVDQGVWLIRNYFNLQARAFATNSFMIDYDPDFVGEVAAATNDAELLDVANRSYNLIRRAALPSGLLHQIVQPEIFITYSDDRLLVFSPNDVVPVDDSCQEVERSLGQVPELGRRLLQFTLEREPPLLQFYYGRTSEPATDRRVDAKAYPCLVRLAVKLDHAEARATYLPLLMKNTEDWLRAPNPWYKMATMAEVIEALRVVRSANSPSSPLPPAPTINAPAEGFVATDMSPLLTWSNPPGTTQVHLQVTPYNNDGPGIDLIRDAQTSYQVTGPEFGAGNYVLLPGMTYIWRVRSTTSANPLGAGDPGWSGWTARTFKTPVVTSTTIAPASPAHGAVVASLTPTVRWDNANRRVFYYEFQLSKDLNFGSGPAGSAAMVYSALVHGAAADPPNSYTVPAAFPLEPKTSYFWRVRPRVQGDAAPVAWSNVWSFYVE